MLRMESNVIDNVKVPQLDNLLKLDPYLAPYQREIKRRYHVFETMLKTLDAEEGGLEQFTLGYTHFGIHVDCTNNDIKVKEWVPAARAVFIRGDFNGWQEKQYPLRRNEFGVWEITIPALSDGSTAIKHNSAIKLLVETHDGRLLDRLCPWSRYVFRAPEANTYHGVFYNPPADQIYKFKHAQPKKKERLKIYEAHIGISSWEGKIATYDNFRQNVIPRIVKQGYNTIQLMAVMEHAYYASFGYQVTSFFAASSRFGTPEELKALIDEAHKHDLTVLLDLVHSHACKNTADGLNQFDGTNGCYFHDNERGFHNLWDSRCFNYSAREVQRFLLSNIRFWLEEYKFDGFRFDGVSSMLYHTHGIGHAFSGTYDEYFGLVTDTESFNYLQLANHISHTMFPESITIAEEVSGMPTLCRPIAEGGGGFDYRLAMAIPDVWIKLLKETKDENWHVGNITWTLINRRWSEKSIAYSESHDQALVGDKTIAHWLMDTEIYSNMTVFAPRTPVVERGLALHKLIRLLTYGLGGEGWLNFEGNEFGHPEWLDFPREGNNNSYHYARRLFYLPDDETLRYKYLNAWDRAMNDAEEKYQWLSATNTHLSRRHEDDKVVVFERGKHGLLWIFNFHSSKSFADYKVGTNRCGKYKIVLNSDSKNFDGLNRVDNNQSYFTQDTKWDGRRYSLQVYIPSRVALVLALVQ
ncbi:unnamed protein product [Didymodactylos carnosus]|uniref:1,4-alpha-glucan branching enzyme n=1 Tax=Didymodactylos carnosus TaxID=1234261 RepID=A0A813VI12_9BILA|nr:unnamed protein product [Didymodactylos carnosus]CAF0837767.1 unnamed protein product [Didymodactylos carnosus]CAF3533212.1 unnamed protein product [Didymodactylos carnosus]CAF3625016.1 unnamed protein product [Didymodactylos carnosus]